MECAAAEPPLTGGAPPPPLSEKAPVTAQQQQTHTPQTQIAEPSPVKSDECAATDDVGVNGNAKSDGDRGPHTAETVPDVDFTSIPAMLDAKLELLDVESAIRPTTINVGPVWTRKAQKALLGQPSVQTLHAEQQKEETQKAYDLLDALSRSGSLPIDCASLHVIIAATHTFDSSLMDTVVVKNVNPIEKLERTSLLIANTIHGQPADRLIRVSQYERVSTYSAPALLPPRD